MKLSPENLQILKDNQNNLLGMSILDGFITLIFRKDDGEIVPFIITYEVEIP